MNLPTIDTLAGSKYNTYGYDSLNVVAHICHLFSRPEWQVTTKNLGLEVVSADECLIIPCGMVWWSFYSQDQAYFSVESKSLPPFYRVHDALHVANPDFVQMQGEKDWGEAIMMAAGKWASQNSHVLELKTLHKDNEQSFKEDVADESLKIDLETFYFQYPSLRSLVHAMAQIYPVQHVLDNHECELVMTNGIEYIDDFTLVSGTKIHAWTKIPMEKIQALYVSAEAMIKEFHTEKKIEIEEIQEFRAAWCTRVEDNEPNY